MCIQNIYTYEIVVLSLDLSCKIFNTTVLMEAEIGMITCGGCGLVIYD